MISSIRSEAGRIPSIFKIQQPMNEWHKFRSPLGEGLPKGVDSRGKEWFSSKMFIVLQVFFKYYPGIPLLYILYPYDIPYHIPYHFVVSISHDIPTKKIFQKRIRVLLLFYCDYL